MYKILLVDDERIIVDGISKIVDWKAIGTELIGTARNGIEALQCIDMEQPHIVISDIKMPGMNGLQLAEELHHRYPAIRIILLSGFSEFDYAKQAMQYGVKHYLLKPCNEADIIKSLEELIAELEQDSHQANFIQSMQLEMQKIMPHAKEQFLKELVTNKMYGHADWEQYGRLFQIEQRDTLVQIILFHLDGNYEYEHLFALHNITKDILPAESILLSSTIGTNVLVLVREQPQELLVAKLKEINTVFMRYYKLEATVAISSVGSIVDAKSLYRETQECIAYRFYLEEGSIITKRDVVEQESEASRFTYDEEALCMHIKFGDWRSVEQELEHYFTMLNDRRIHIQLMKSYVIQLYISIVRQCDSDDIQAYLNQMSLFEAISTLNALQQLVTEIAKEICTTNFNKFTNKHSSIVNRLLQVIEEELCNSLLSLNWVATEVMFMNVDYLGKLFKKEVGDKFSNYVMKLRMEKAKAEILASEDVLVFELAEKLGFGSNPQYFSQVFKKYTGFTPTEFKRSS